MGHEQDPARSAARRATRSRKLGPDASCAHCGITNPDALRRNRVEDHHVVGQALDSNLTAVVCLNCHSIMSNAQTDAGSVAQPVPDNLLERVIRMLRSSAVFFENYTHWLLRLADWLEGLVRDLDDKHPTWRQLPGALA